MTKPADRDPVAQPGGNDPRPDSMPEPSIWPAALALGVTLLVWGLVTSLIVTGVGAVLFVTALAGWIAEIRHERTDD